MSLLAHAAPLLEEERHARTSAQVADRDNPFLSHWPCSGSALTANYRPTDTGEVKATKMFQQRFDRQEPNACRSCLQVAYSRQAVLAILHADSPPDVLL